MAKKATKAAAARRIAKQLIAQRDAGKEAYAQADKALQELFDLGLKPGDTITLPGGTTVELVDNFADRNKVWKPCGVTRFDVKVTHA